MTTPLAIGKTNYKGGSAGGNAALPEKLTFYKLGHKAADGKDRVLIVRGAPPIGPLAETGVWRRFMKQHFGYGFNVITGSGEKRFIPATFLCIEETDREGNVKVQCPECNEIKLRKAKKEAKEVEMKAAGKTEEEIDTALKHVKMWLREHNVDKKWWMNAKDPSGKWGILTISYSSMKLYMEILKELTEKNFDPLGAEKGLWFRFTRRGNSFNDIKDIPTVEMDTAQDGSMRMRLDTLTDGDLVQLAALPPLTEHGRVLTYDQIDELVKSGGDEQVVRTVMNIPVSNNRAPDQGGKKPEAGSGAPTPAPVSASDEVARLKAALAAAEAKSAEPKAQVPNGMLKPVGAPDMPMEDFMKTFES